MKDYFWACNYLIDGEKLWFVPFWYNLLCCFDLEKKEMILMEEIPEKLELPSLYFSVAKVNQKIVLVPGNAKKIGIYDIDKEQFTMIPLKYDRERMDKFSDCVVYENNVYFFPAHYEFIVKLDLKTQETSYFPLLKEQADAWRLQICVVDHMVYLLSSTTNRVLMFDMVSCDICIKQIGKEEKIYSIIFYINEKFYLADVAGNIYVFKELDKCIEMFANKTNLEATGLYSGFCLGSELFLFPESGSGILKCHISNGEIKAAEFEKQIMEKNDSKFWLTLHYSFAKKWKDYLLVWGLHNHKLFFVSFETKKIEECYVISKEMELDYIKKITGEYTANDLLLEAPVAYRSLKGYIEKIEKKANNKEKSQNIGEIIYTALR